MLATAHATSVDEFVYSLAGYPLRVPALEIAEIDLLVLLDAWLDGRGFRREVRAIVNLTVGTEPGSLSPVILAERSGRGSPLTIDMLAAQTFVGHLGGDPQTLEDEIERRATKLVTALDETGR
jgi:hypothetical protein